mgnify:CR=1 FL=1
MVWNNGTLCAAVSDLDHQSGPSDRGGALVDLGRCGRADDQWVVSLPLLGLGRPRNESVVPHPMVPGWQPTPAAQRRATEEDAIAWIRGMHRPRPAYPVQFQMPQPPAKPAPGSAPTDER